MKTIAVAPYAALRVPMESNIDAMMKQIERPVADVIKRTRLPKRSTVCKPAVSHINTPRNYELTHRGINDANIYVTAVNPPKIRERSRDKPIVFW